MGPDARLREIHPLSKDEQFQSRKEQNPLKKKETMEQIGDNRKYDGVKYDDSKLKYL